VDAVPRTHVLPRPAQDAVVGVEHQVLRRLDPLGEPRRVHRLHHVVGVDVHLGLRERHQRYPPVGRVSLVAPRSFRRQFCMIVPRTRTTINGTVDSPIATASRISFSQKPCRVHGITGGRTSCGAPPSHFSFWSAKYSQNEGITATVIMMKNVRPTENTMADVQ